MCQAELAIRSDVMDKFLSQIAPLVCVHPEYQEKDWNEEDDIADVLRHVISEFQRVTPKDLGVIFQIDDLEITPYWIKECDECYSYGNLLPCDWLATLSGRYPTLYRLSIDFFSFCFHHLDISIWNEWDEECHIEYLLEEIDGAEEHGTELDEDELKELCQNITYYKNHIAHYASRILSNEISVEGFRTKLNTYKPRKTKYKKFKEWMLGALEIYKLGFNFRDANCPFIIPENFYNNGELEPYRYIRFIWSNDDKVGKGVSDSICDNAGNFGIIPLLEFEMINTGDIANPLKRFGTATKFYNWMSDGHQITYDLTFKP